ncbi:unnamed protein product [Sphagnum balticum]
MLVSQIAYDHLTQTQQTAVLNQFYDLIKAFNPFTDGKSNTWAEAAVWPDDLKTYKANFFDNYHFTNILDGRNISLHSYFDSICLDQDPDVRIIRPLSDSDRKSIEDEAKRIADEYPASAFGSLVEVINPHNWGVEAYQLAVSDIYSFVKTHINITQEYQDTMR